MYAFSIGVLLDSFRTGWREALPKAAALGVKGHTGLRNLWRAGPGRRSPGGQAGVPRRRQAEGLRISALCGDLGAWLWGRRKNPELTERPSGFFPRGRGIWRRT